MAAMNRIRWGIVILTVVTAVIHLGLWLLFSDFIFLLNGIGYIGLLFLLYFFQPLADRREIIRWVLIAYTAVTFVLYFIFNWPNIWGPLGLADKLVELVLIVLLFMDRE